MEVDVATLESKKNGLIKGFLVYYWVLQLYNSVVYYIDHSFFLSRNIEYAVFSLSSVWMFLIIHVIL